MKKTMLKLPFFLSLIFSFSAFGNFNASQRQELDRKVFKAKQHLKEVVTSDLKSTTGVKELLVDLDLKVNSYQIYKEVASIDESWNKIETMQLPSLFVDIDDQGKLKEVKSIEMEHILSHVSSVSVKIHTPYDILDEAALKGKISEIIKANLKSDSRFKLDIKIEKTKQMLVDNRKDSLSTPMYMKVVDEVKNLIPVMTPYVLGGLGIITIGFLLFLMIFNRSMGKMASAIDEIDVTGNLTASLPPTNNNQNQENALERLTPNAPMNTGGGISSYLDLVAQIKKMVKTQKDLIVEMIQLHFHLGEVHKILILLNILSVEEREDIYKELKANHLSDLKKYVVDKGESLYADEERLNSIAQEIFRVVSIAMVKPESFYQIYLKKVIISLSADEIANVIRACNEKELMYFLENVDGVKLAFVTATRDLGGLEFNPEVGDLNGEETKAFVHKLAKFIYVKGAVIEGNAKAKLVPHLSDGIEASYLKSMGISTELSFKNLVANYFDIVEEYIKEQSFSDINAMFALFSEGEQEAILKALPDLVAERIQSREIEMSERTFALKLDLYEKLKKHHQIEQKEKIQNLNDELIGNEYKKLISDKDMEHEDVA